MPEEPTAQQAESLRMVCTEIGENMRQMLRTAGTLTVLYLAMTGVSLEAVLPLQDTPQLTATSLLIVIGNLLVGVAYVGSFSIILRWATLQRRQFDHASNALGIAFDPGYRLAQWMAACSLWGFTAIMGGWIWLSTVL